MIAITYIVLFITNHHNNVQREERPLPPVDLEPDSEVQANPIYAPTLINSRIVLNNKGANFFNLTWRYY